MNFDKCVHHLHVPGGKWNIDEHSLYDFLINEERKSSPQGKISQSLTYAGGKFLQLLNIWTPAILKYIF